MKLSSAEFLRYRQDDDKATAWKETPQKIDTNNISSFGNFTETLM